MFSAIIGKKKQQKQKQNERIKARRSVQGEQ